MAMNCSGVESPTGPHPDHKAVHGMVIMGRGPFYVSHLPLYYPPHDYQAVYEVDIEAGPGKDAYLADLRANPGLHSVQPQAFVLPDARVGQVIPVELFRGHFERDGTSIAPSVNLVIRRVIYFRKLSAADSRESGRYFMFGNSNEAFIAHRIGGRPDYDQLMAVTAEPALRQRLAGQPNIELTIPGLNIQSNSTLNVTAPVTATIDGQSRSLPARTLYFETGDLEN